MKKVLLSAVAAAALAMPAVAANRDIAVQDGFALEPVYEVSIPNNNVNYNRSLVAIKDKIYKPCLFTSNIEVYSKEGALIKTITAPAGYKVWTSCNVDAAGHLIVEVDNTTKSTFGDTGGNITANGGHGILIIDTDTDAIALKEDKTQVPVLQMNSSAQRFDCMGAITQDIFTEEAVGIYHVPMSVVAAPTAANFFRYLYNDRAGTPKPNWWSVAAKPTVGVVGSTSLFPSSAAKVTSTAYAMQFHHQGAQYFSIIIYANHTNGVTNSAGGYGNAIRRYTSGYAAEDFYYTPQHSGLTGFNFFNLGGKDYIIYPAGDNLAADAFAIAEVSYVSSPKTDMSMEGEKLVAGKPVGVLKAFNPGAKSGSNVAYAGNTACAPSYTVVPVEGDENSVYIFAANPGAPMVKYKFSINVPIVEPIPDREEMADGTHTFSADGFQFNHGWSVFYSDATSDRVRNGVGVNGHYFTADYTRGTVKVYNQNEYVKEIIIPGKQAWISLTSDDAGHVVVRCDDKGFSTSYPYYNHLTSAVAVIDANTLELVKVIPFASSDNLASLNPKEDGEIGIRFDAMGHIYGDILGGEAHFYAPSTRFGARMEHFTFRNGECVSHENVPVSHHEAFTGTASANNQTLGSAQQFSPTEMAVYSNPNSEVTSSNLGKGNGIELYELVGGVWTATGRYFLTPNHSAIGGFHIFEMGGERFIIYPSGTYASADGFSIARVEFTDSPLTTEAEGSNVVLTKNTAGAMAAKRRAPAAGNNANSYFINYATEPSATAEGGVDIYPYNGGARMSQYSFVADPEHTPTGIGSVAADEAEAPVEYFNLQGMRVDNPAEGGIYIRRQGARVSKVIL